MKPMISKSSRSPCFSWPATNGGEAIWQNHGGQNHEVRIRKLRRAPRSGCENDSRNRCRTPHGGKRPHAFRRGVRCLELTPNLTRFTPFQPGDF